MQLLNFRTCKKKSFKNFQKKGNYFFTVMYLRTANILETNVDSKKPMMENWKIKDVKENLTNEKDSEDISI